MILSGFFDDLISNSSEIERPHFVVDICYVHYKPHREAKIISQNATQYVKRYIGPEKN